MELENKMIEEDYNKYKKFLKLIETGFSDKDLDIVYRLHAKYFNHQYNIPCGCGGAKKLDVINSWIKDLTKVYENGIQT